ncbi:hypothetical protein ABT026_28220 [Streptomyces sp. NPDC002734]|uniref:hypothetical protein n=1 Tax=Streptomyces sp. NPDC002734 TaxID=3154426 RepID=UPI003319AE90
MVVADLPEQLGPRRVHRILRICERHGDTSDGVDQTYFNYLKASGYWSALYTGMLYTGPIPAMAKAAEHGYWFGDGPWV